MVSSYLERQLRPLAEALADEAKKEAALRAVMARLARQKKAEQAEEAGK